jgi:D-arabinonate dehydratase
MEIIDVKARMLEIPLKKEFRDATHTLSRIGLEIVEVYTDKEIVGIGTTYGIGGSLFGIKSIIDMDLKNILIGRDPLETEKLWNEMYSALKLQGRKGTVMCAISAIDIALWDIKGKLAGLPLYKLLGGYQSKVPAYGSGGALSLTLDELQKEMKGFLDDGFKAVKMKVGSKDEDEDLKRVKYVRDLIGDDIKLMVDANEGWTVKRALRMAKKLEKYDIYWLEEPVSAYDYAGLAEVAKRTDIPIATGEHEYTKWGFKTLIENGCADVIQVDVFRVGGITEWVKVCGMAAAYGLPVAPHGGTGVHDHLVAAFSNAIIVEYFEFLTKNLMEVAFVDPRIPRGGYLEIPSTPGLGLELNEQTLIKYEVKR